MLALAICSVFTCQSALGIVLTWDGSLSALWKDKDNWIPDAAPKNGDSLVFVGMTNRVTTNDSNNRSFIGISFANTTDGQGFTLNGNTITMDGVISTATTVGTIEDVINLSIVMGGAMSIDAATGRAVTMNGVLSGAQQLTLNDIAADGLVRLNAANTYSGGTSIKGGTVVVGNSAALGAGAVVIADGSSTDPVLELIAGLTVVNAITIDNLGGNKEIRLSPSGGGSAVLSGTLTILEDGNLSFDVSVNGADTLTLSGAVVGTGNAGINKIGTGILELTGMNTYTGATTVSAGTLLINGDSSAATGAVRVLSGAVLSGAGSSGGALALSGTMAPGDNGVGSFAAASAVFADGSALSVEMDSSSALGAAADLLVLNGNFSLTGVVNLSLSDSAPAPTVFVSGTTFSLVNYSGVWDGGLFTYGATLLGDGAIFSDGLNTWLIDYNATTEGVNFTGDHIAGDFVNITAQVPEPSTAALLVGVLALGWAMTIRRR